METQRTAARTTARTDDNRRNCFWNESLPMEMFERKKMYTNCHLASKKSYHAPLASRKVCCIRKVDYEIKIKKKNTTESQ